MTNTALIIGASSGVGKELTFLLAQKGYNLIISARDSRTLISIKKHLELKYSNNIYVVKLDLYNDSVEEYLLKCKNAINNIREVYITAGMIDPNDHGNIALTSIKEITEINFLSIASIIRQSYEVYKELKSINVISSIAAHIPRGKNIVYGSAKKALENYCLGLRHYFSQSTQFEVSINIVALGYADTALAYEQKVLLPKANPQKVAHFLFKNRYKNKGLKFYPFYWRYIIWLLKLVPWVIFKKLKF